MTRWMNREEIESLARVTSGECPLCQSETSKSRLEAEPADIVSVSIPESWVDRIQVGFPRANWW